MFVYTPTLKRATLQTLVGVTPEPQEKTGADLCQERMIKTDKKSKIVALRFRESDHQIIKQKAEKAKMNFTEFVTTSALGKKITVIEGLDEVLKEQKAIGRNINQLTTLCNMGRINCPDLKEVKEQYARVLTLLNEIVGRCK